jgi:8-oxo-dGTP pyrophosphatase MutT (NUDIX family)
MTNSIPTFHNRPNPRLKVIEQLDQQGQFDVPKPGQIIYQSRSVAVVAIPIFVKLNTIYVPLQRRIEKAGDEESGRWCLPCGYLDWDEDCWQAMARECWEELALDVNLYPVLAGSITEPYKVNGDPNSDLRQNVTLRYRWYSKVDELPELIVNQAEASEAQWYPLISIQERAPLGMAFNHQELIEEATRWVYQQKVSL